jgi:hypothetical protein
MAAEPFFKPEPNRKLMESNELALAVVDAQFADLERKIAALDRLTDDLQTSRVNIQKLDAEADRLINDSDNLERSKRASKLSILNASLEIERSDNSRIIAAIQSAKTKVLASGRAARELIGRVLWQLLQTRRLNATLMLERELVIRKVPVRLSDLANTARGVVELRDIEETLTRPLRNRDEEISMLYTLKTRYHPVHEACLGEANLALELRTAEEPVVSEPAATNLEPALT